MPKKSAGSVLSQRPPTNARSLERARDRAGPTLLARRRVDGGERPGEAGRDDCDRAERRADADEVGDAAEHRADHEPEHREPEHRAEGLTAPGTRDADRGPGERARPRRGAGQPLGEASDAERDRATGEREGETREREHDQAHEDAALRPDPADEQPSRNPTDERAAAVRAEQEAGLELRQVVVVGEAREERDDRSEQHRVEEDDGAGDGDDATHSPDLDKGARLRPRRPDAEGGLLGKQRVTWDPSGRIPSAGPLVGPGSAAVATARA